MFENIDKLVYYAEAGIAFFLYAVIIVTIGLIVYSYYKKKKKLQFIEHSKNYLSKLRISSLRVLTASIVLLLVILFTLGFSLLFIEDYIGDYMLLIFVAFMAFYISYFFYGVIRLNRLSELDYGKYKFMYDFAEEICDRFDIKMPKLKTISDIGINAFTISFFGRKSIIAFTTGLLELYERNILSKREITAIVGHEIGHIVNNDSTIATFLRPLVIFVQRVKDVIKWITIGIVKLIKTIVGSAWDSGSIILIAIALGIATGLAILLILVGFWLIIFLALAYSIHFSWTVYNRQVEYSSDLFSAMAIQSPQATATALMGITRGEGLLLLREIIASGIIKDQYENGEITVFRLINPWYYKEVVKKIDIKGMIIKNPKLIDKVPMPDARYLLKKRGIKAFNEQDCKDFAQFKTGFVDSLKELKYDHPSGIKRVKFLSSLI